MPGVVGEMRSALGEQHARLVAFDDRHQHRGQSDRPHRSNGGDHRGIGVVLVVPRDDVRIGEPRRHIERKPFLRTRKKFRRAQCHGRSIANRAGPRAKTKSNPPMIATFFIKWVCWSSTWSAGTLQYL